MKVPVEIEIDLNTKQFEVSVGVPTTSALIVKELGIAKGSGTPHSEKVGDLTMKQVIHIVKQKRPSLLSKDIKHAVKEILGSCVSMGVTVEGKEAKTVQQEINNGLYDELLNQFLSH